MTPTDESQLCVVGGGGTSGGTLGAGSMDKRRSISSLFTGRRKSSSRLAPTLVVCDETNTEIPLRQVRRGSSTASIGGGGGVFASNASAGGGETAGGQQLSTLAPPDSGRVLDIPKDIGRSTRQKKLRAMLFSQKSRKMVIGVMIMCAVTVSWVAAVNFVKMTYWGDHEPSFPNTTNMVLKALHQGGAYDAPFLTTWLSTGLLLLFYPVYSVLMCVRCPASKNSSSTVSDDSLIDCIRCFRDRGLSFGQFLWRTCLFCALWVLSTYMHVRSLRVLACSDVTALMATSVAFVYLLSWVVLHEQFVGVRIVAVIMCNTGIALLAYMNGMTKTPTLGAVVMTATGSASLAVYKVFYRKMVGRWSVGVESLFYSVVALLAALLLWPLQLALAASGAEKVGWPHVPWLELAAAAGSLLVYHMLCTFASLVTYTIFVTLGVLFAIPVCTVVDVYWYHEQFNSMRLAGIVLIFCGFLLVLFPNDWPAYIRTAIRWGRRHHNHNHTNNPEPVDYRTGVISRSRLRSPSGHVR